MKILMMAASLRKESFNKKLIDILQEIALRKKIETQSVDFAHFSAPLYNYDIEESLGIPPTIADFIEHLNQTDALILASPEYNFSIPAPLKNLIDWVSRATPSPFKARPILLLSASPALCGGARGLLDLSTSLRACGAYVSPLTFSLSEAHNVFVEDNVTDPKLYERLEKRLMEFIPFAEKRREG